MIRAAILCIVLVLGSSAHAFAHNPILEPPEPQQTAQANLALAVPIGDPTLASAAIYGRLGQPDEVDIYRFTPSKSDQLPFDALVPVRSSLSDFRPMVALIAFGLGVRTQEGLPVPLPEGYGAIFVTDYKSAPRSAFFEPYSMERYWKSGTRTVELPAGVPAYIAVFEPTGQTGEYVLGAGSVENFSAMTLREIVLAVFALKLGLFGGFEPPWLDIAGILLTAAGFAIAFGPTLSRLVALIAIKDKPSLDDGKRITNWVLAGLIVMVIGALLLHRVSGVAGIVPFQIALAITLVFLWLPIQRRAYGRWPLVTGMLIALVMLLAMMLLFAWHLTVLV
jgi:hypothetical protein